MKTNSLASLAHRFELFSVISDHKYLHKHARKYNTHTYDTERFIY